MLEWLFNIRIVYYTYLITVAVIVEFELSVIWCRKIGCAIYMSPGGGFELFYNSLKYQEVINHWNNKNKMIFFFLQEMFHFHKKTYLSNVYFIFMKKMKKKENSKEWIKQKMSSYRIKWSCKHNSNRQWYKNVSFGLDTSCKYFNGVK